MNVFDTFDELMMHHDVCSLSVLEIQTWIKKSVKDTWKAWRTKEVDWRPSTGIPNVLHQDTTSLLAQVKKEIKSNMFWGWIRTSTFHGILMKFTFIWIQTHVYTLPETSAMTKLLPRGFLSRGAASP